ncbi:MAG TPA: carbohydrate ABC transporter permease [Acidimicrobiales bacterium]|nr:carbohydrate ABC transporter permease [Acidimicrobiales bacterium]
MIVARRNTVMGTCLLLALMVVTLLPLASMFTSALFPSGTYPLGISWPAHPQWDNFVQAFQTAQMGTMFQSSVAIVIGVVPVSVLISTLAGFALGHLRVKGGQVAFVLFVLGLTLPYEGVIVPLYYEVRHMGLLGSRWAIILPLIGLFMPFGVYWMRAHFINAPYELSEAARVDGATTWQLFWRVHVPLARPAVTSLGILLSVWTWNQFLLSLVLVENPTNGTMAGSLGAFQGQYGTNIPLLSAGSLLILAPVILLFVAFQRHFVTALVQGSLKG